MATNTATITNARAQKAEEMFDSVGFDYEIVCAEHCNHLLDVLKNVVRYLPSESQILDIGSGTGKPTAAFFAKQGHTVTGLDISQTMVEVARKQVPEAQFFKADITVYEPPEGVRYDAIVASHSLYQFSLSALRSQILKFTSWTKKNGYVIVGTNLKPDEMAEQNKSYDHRGWVEGLIETFMGHQAKCTIGLPEAWCKLFADCGLEVLDVNRKVCQPVGGSKSDIQDQFFITSRKIVDNVYIGPYPLPEQLPQPFQITENNSEAWVELYQKMVRRDVQAAKKAIVAAGSQSVLCIGPGAQELKELLQPECKSIHSIEFATQDGKVFGIPFPDNTFDAVVSLWALQYAQSLESVCKEIIRVINKSEKGMAVLVQAAPDNDFINLVNDALRDLELPGSPKTPLHQGKLLATAEMLFKDAGFSKTSFVPVQNRVQFHNERDTSLNNAAQLSARIWCSETTLLEEVKTKLLQPLTTYFGDRPGEIGYQGTMMIAKCQ